MAQPGRVVLADIRGQTLPLTLPLRALTSWNATISGQVTRVHQSIEFSQHRQAPDQDNRGPHCTRQQSTCPA
jgi:hypothetical protein